METVKTCKPGDKIECMGITVTIETIFYQFFSVNDGWDIEFLDSNGKYRNWKQYYDGGKLIVS